ncbi:hypothetical protein ACWKWA_08260 [Dermacoccus abyssi]
MDVSKQLAQAWADVEAAGLPEHVQGVALVEALRIRGGDAAEPGHSRNGDSGAEPKGKPAKKPAVKSKASRGDAAAARENATVDEEEFFAAIAHETEVPVDTLESLIFLNDGEPRINVTRRALGQSLKQGQIAVTSLIVVARHFGLGEAEVQDSAVREECQRLGIFDRNFAGNVKGIPGLLQTGARSKTFKVRAAGVDSFVSTVDALIGETKAE